LKFGLKAKKFLHVLRLISIWENRTLNFREPVADRRGFLRFRRIDEYEYSLPVNFRASGMSVEKSSCAFRDSSVFGKTER
jgi:hypothetical protein